MKTYTEAEIIEKIQTKKEINFFAMSITPWHALGVNANIYLLKQQGIKLNGFIIISEHPVTGKAIGPDNFNILLSDSIEIIEMKNVKDKKDIAEALRIKYIKYHYFLFGKSKKKSTNDLLYWIAPLQPYYELIPKIDCNDYAKKVVTILIDEGLGTYVDNEFICCKWSFREGGILNGLRSVWHMFIRNKIFLQNLKTSNSLRYEQLFSRSKKGLIPNKKVIEAYRKTIKFGSDHADYKEYEKAAIINSNMLFEIGILKERIDIKLFHEICDILEQQNISVVLKPHPREREVSSYESLNCKLETSRVVAQESIFSNLQCLPYCIIGFDTTTLVSAKLLFNIDSISINKLVDKKYLLDKNRFNKFNACFSNIVYLPETMNEFLEDFQRIKEKYDEKNN